MSLQKPKMFLKSLDVGLLDIKITHVKDINEIKAPFQPSLSSECFRSQQNASQTTTFKGAGNNPTHQNEFYTGTVETDFMEIHE